VLDEETRLVLGRWRAVLDALRADPASCSAQVEWVAKLSLLERFRERAGAAWDDPRVRAMDIQWHDLDPARGLAQRLRAAGQLERLVDEEAVTAAVSTPPSDTRAWFRGEVVRRFGTDVRAASWDSVVLLDERGRVQRVQLPEPTAGTREQTAALLDRHTRTASLLTELVGSDTDL
jgi:proteasome accessory factor A